MRTLDPFPAHLSSGSDQRTEPAGDMVTTSAASAISADVHDAGADVRQKGVLSAVASVGELAGEPVVGREGEVLFGLVVGRSDLAVEAAIGEPPPVQAPSAIVSATAPERRTM